MVQYAIAPDLDHYRCLSDGDCLGIDLLADKEILIFMPYSLVRGDAEMTPLMDGN
jgi:hypothetical protein